MQKQLLLAIILLLCSTLYAQNIEDEIRNYNEPSSTLIKNGRNFIMDNLSQDNWEKANEAYLFLNNRFGSSNFNVFSFWEQVYLATILQNYNYALEAIANFKDLNQVVVISGISFNNPSNSFYNQFEYDLALIMVENFSIYFTQIDNSELSFEQKTALKLVIKKQLLAYSISPLEYAINQETLNTESTQFLKDNPTSIYSNYLINYVRYEYEYDRGLGIDFGLGTSFLTSTLRENFQPNVNFTFGIEGSLKKHTLYLQASLISSKNPIEIAETPFELPIPEKTPILFAVGELSYGYNIFTNKKISITPFTGIGVFEQSFASNFTSKNPQYEEYHKDHFAYTAGLNFDINVFKNMTYNEMKLPLRIRISYVKPVVNNYSYLNGSMLNLSLGFALKGWEQKRIY